MKELKHILSGTLVLVALLITFSCDDSIQEEKDDPIIPWGTLTYEIDGVIYEYDVDDFIDEGIRPSSLGLLYYKSEGFYQFRYYKDFPLEYIGIDFPSNVTITAGETYDACTFRISALDDSDVYYVNSCDLSFTVEITRWDSVAEGTFSGTMYDYHFYLDNDAYNLITVENGHFEFLNKVTYSH